MIVNKSCDIFLTVAKIFVFINVVFLGGTLYYVRKHIPELAKHDTHANTCLTNSTGDLECNRTETLIDSYVREVLEIKYNDTKTKEMIEREEFFSANIQTASSYSSPLSSAMRPSAKLIGKKCPEKNDTKEMTPIDVWLEDMELEKNGGFLRHGVRCYKGRLVVPVAGSYFVYSLVEFYEPCFYTNGTPNVEDKTSPIKHGIYKYSTEDDKNTAIVLSVQPHKIATKGNDENVYSSHISTVLHLNAGDELSVQVSNVTLLSYRRDNYFGLNLIP